jgi:hypothetical protein
VIGVTGTLISLGVTGLIIFAYRLGHTVGVMDAEHAAARRGLR